MYSESLVPVAEDLEFLRTWYGPAAKVSSGEIRRGSAILRRLLVEDAYGKAWRAIGGTGEPHVIAVDIMGHLRGIPEHQVDYALALGAWFEGHQVVAQKSVRGPFEAQTYKFHFRPHGYPGERDYALSEYLGSPSGLLKGRKFTRRDVIKYVANVKGGVHLGDKEQRAERKLLERMGDIEKQLTLRSTTSLLVEVVAIAEAVSTSTDARYFVETVLGQSVLSAREAFLPVPTNLGWTSGPSLP